MRLIKKLTASENTLVVGAGSFIRDLLAEIRRQPGCKYRVTGIVAWEEPEQACGYGHPVLGTVEKLHQIIKQHKTEIIIVEPPDDRPRAMDRQLLEARIFQNVRIEHAQDVFERLTGRLPLETYAPKDIIYSNDFRPSRASLMASRLLSLVFASIGLILLAPIMLFIAFLIRIDSPGPVIFSQERSGMAGRSFKLYKFRTMVPSDTHDSEWEEDNVCRITRVGRWLRKSRLDELPQFFNVLCGDMNMVGPRPHPSSNYELFVLAARNTPDSGLEIPYYSMRHSVRPGITGWAQVRYRYANNLFEEMEKLRFDLYYLKHYSLWLDIQILAETVSMIFIGSRHKRVLIQDWPQKTPHIATTPTDYPQTIDNFQQSSNNLSRQSMRRGDAA